MIEFRCKNIHCNKLIMKYYISGNDVRLKFDGLELKCEKCKRVFRLKNYTEKMIQEKSQSGIFRI